MFLECLRIEFTTTGGARDKLCSCLRLFNLCSALSSQLVMEVGLTRWLWHAGKRIALWRRIHYCRLLRSERILHIFIEVVRRRLLISHCRLVRQIIVRHLIHVLRHTLVLQPVSGRKSGSASFGRWWLEHLIIILSISISWIILITLIILNISIALIGPALWIIITLLLLVFDSGGASRLSRRSLAESHSISSLNTIIAIVTFHSLRLTRRANIWLEDLSVVALRLHSWCTSQTLVVVVIDLWLVNARRAWRNVLLAILSVLIGVSMAASVIHSTVGRPLHLIINLAASLIGRTVVDSCRSFRLTVTTVRHSLLQQCQATSCLFNVALWVVSLPIGSQMSRVLSDASLSEITEVLLRLQVLLAEANCCLLAIRRSSHHIMRDSLHAGRCWALRRIHVGGWPTKVLVPRWQLLTVGASWWEHVCKLIVLVILNRAVSLHSRMLLLEIAFGRAIWIHNDTLSAALSEVAIWIAHKSIRTHIRRSKILIVLRRRPTKVLHATASIQRGRKGIHLWSHEVFLRILGVLLETTWVTSESIIRIWHVLIICHLRILILAIVHSGLLVIVHSEGVLHLSATLQARRAQHACRCGILPVHVRHLRRLVRSAICRALPNEILPRTLKYIARWRGTNSSILPLLPQLLCPLHLLFAFGGIVSCIATCLVWKSSCGIHLTLLILVWVTFNELSVSAGAQ